jgi:hypothetical protein
MPLHGAFEIERQVPPRLRHMHVWRQSREQPLKGDRDSQGPETPAGDTQPEVEAFHRVCRLATVQFSESSPARTVQRRCRPAYHQSTSSSSCSRHDWTVSASASHGGDIPVDAADQDITAAITATFELRAHSSPTGRRSEGNPMGTDLGSRPPWWRIALDGSAVTWRKEMARVKPSRLVGTFQVPVRPSREPRPAQQHDLPTAPVAQLRVVLAKTHPLLGLEIAGSRRVCRF